MPEPTDHHPFSHFDPEVPVPLSAADIRRRGDRLRRRNTGLAIAGGVAVIALIAAPLAVLAGGDDSDALPPSAPPTSVVDPNGPSPSPIPPPATTPLVTEIPDDFPLAASYPDTNEDLTPVTVVADVPPTDFDLCLGEGFNPDTSSLTDSAEVRFSAPEDNRARLLTVWADEPSAAAALRSAQDTLSACNGDGFATTERESSYDTEALVFTRQATADVNSLSLDVYEVVRVRNAVYLSYDTGEGGPTNEAAEGGVDAAFEASGAVVAAAYDVFSNEPGPDDGVEPGSEPGSAASAGLLALGDLPERDRLGAWAEDPADTVTWACGPAGLFSDLDAEGSAAVRYAASGADDEGGPTIGRVRTAVLQFSPEDDAAERAYDALQDNLAFCAEEDDDIDALAEGGFLQGIGDDASYGAFTYAAPEICTDCDGVWFDRMAVARVGDRVVVVSYAEVGGPLQPAGLGKALRDVLERAVDLA